MTAKQSQRPSATTQWLVDQLRHAIIDGALRERTPVRQEDIAAHYDVSRMPVREALQRLEAEGWIEHRPYKGAYVAALDSDDVRELFDIRAALERLAAQRTFADLQAEHVTEAVSALEDLEAAPSDAWFAAHKAFHLSLYAAAGRGLYRMIAQQLDAAERYLRLENAVLDVAEKDRNEHRELLDAAKNRDGERAAEIITRHVGDTGEVLATCLRNSKGGGRA